jgi:hypothetical protein
MSGAAGGVGSGGGIDLADATAAIAGTLGPAGDILAAGLNIAKIVYNRATGSGGGEALVPRAPGVHRARPPPAPSGSLDARGRATRRPHDDDRAEGERYAG